MLDHVLCVKLHVEFKPASNIKPMKRARLDANLAARQLQGVAGPTSGLVETRSLSIQTDSTGATCHYEDLRKFVIGLWKDKGLPDRHICNLCDLITKAGLVLH